MPSATIRSALHAAAVSAALLAASVPAWATHPATVRVVLHHRGTETLVTFVDIAVIGTRAPIRLVRRVAGACTRDAAADAPDVLVRIRCETADARVAFEVAREGDDIVVRRGTSAAATDASGPAAPPAPPAAGDAGADDPNAPQVIARAVLPADPVIRVE